MATCKTCTYYYRDGFCTLHLYYTSDDHTCPKHTTEEIPLDYDYLYRLCKQYIHICEKYEYHEKVKKEHIEDFLEDERDKSNSIIKKDYGMLARIFDYAEENDYIKKNFFRGFNKVE